MTFRIALIAALAPNRSIGHGDELPWKMPRYMKFFRRATLGHVVVMGRKTFESLGSKPLPKRINVVLSRSRDYDNPNVRVARNWDEAIDIARSLTTKERLFVIGGGSIYEQAITLADELFLTQIEQRDPNQKALFREDFYGDTFFPKFAKSSWELCYLSRDYRALDSLRARVEDHPNHYFRFWKFARRSTCGCSAAERDKLVARYGDIRPLLEIAP